MKRLLFLLLCCCIFITYLAGAQNIVPNPSFEDKNACPVVGPGSVYFLGPTNTTYPTATSWHTTNSVATTGGPLYLNSCANTSTPGRGVPRNDYGYQFAHTGNAYASIIATNFSTYWTPHQTNQYLEANLTQAMIAGHQYYVSFYVSLANMTALSFSYASTDLYAVAVDKIGAYFSTGAVSTPSYLWLHLTPSVVNATGNYISDTAKWVKIDGVYTATGGEQWITIGHFDSITNNYQQLYKVKTGTPASTYNYYFSILYLDDVCVTDMSVATPQMHDMFVCDASQFPLQLSGNTNGTKHAWNTGDTTSNLNVSQAGTYWQRTWGDCSYYVDTFIVSVGKLPSLDIGPSDTTYCYGTSVTLTTNNAYPNYHWSTGEITRSITVTQSGRYTLYIESSCGNLTDTIDIHIMPQLLAPQVNDTVICQHIADPVLHVSAPNTLQWYEEPGGSSSSQQPHINTDTPASYTYYVSQRSGNCESSMNTINVEITPAPNAQLPGDTALCMGESLVLGTEQGDAYYEWSTGDISCCLSITQSGTYTLRVINDCGEDEDSTTITFSNCKECLWAPDAFTPNSDGKNDIYRLQVQCPISNYHLQIMNRLGQMMYETNDPAQGWDGQYKGQPAAIDMYYYMAEGTPNLPNRNKIFLKGDLMLAR